MRCQYSKSLPCLPSTEFAISQSHVDGSFGLAILAAKILKFGLVMLMHASIASCMMLIIRDRVLYP
jgi:hypothetical protein